ncbi:MAG: Amuc_1100 family pilus-like protein [Kiritimatiellae bacterium]|nr:Amuc_1100 family pilus-like protein [Kiritimatiellia bacterium]
MDKSKTIFIATTSVALVAAVAFGVLANAKFSAASRARSEKDEANSKFRRIYSSEVFPSAGNVAALDDVLKQFENGRRIVTNELVQCNVGLPTETMSASAFQTKLSAGVRNFRSAAPLVDGRKSVADNFAFGFDAYVGTDAMPKDGEIPLLVQQLTVTAMLVREIYGAQVSQLTKIERDAKDEATLKTRDGSRRREAEPEPEPEPRGRRRNRRKAVEEDASAPLFTFQPMAIEFTARQEALVELLNRLNVMRRPFVVVKSISVEKVAMQNDVRKAPAPEAAEDDGRQARSERGGERSRGERGERGGRSRRRRSDAAEERAPETVVQTLKPADMPPEMRIVSGPDVEPLLKVRLGLEIYNFAEEGK